MSNIVSFLVDSVEQYPEHPCIVIKDQEWSYQQVFDHVLGTYAMLKRNGVGEHDRVVLYIDNSLEYVSAFFATLLLDAVVVPVSKTRGHLLEYITEDSEATLLLTQKSLARKLKQLSLPEAAKVVIIDEQAESEPEKAAFSHEMVTNAPDQNALILYTSGTTRNPLGVTLTHKNLEANTTSILDYLHLTHDDSILVTLPFAYSYGNSLLLTHIKAGGTVYIDNRASYPLTILQQIVATKATGYSTVGSYLNLLLKQNEDAYLPAVRSLRYMTFAGESVYLDDIKKLREIAPNLLIYVMYGQTEGSARLSYLEPDLLKTKLGSIGKGIPRVTLRVVNEQGENVNPGEIGEIIARGDNLMKGYWKNDEQTRSVIRDGWLYTGDMATVDGDGFIFIKGRNKDIIKYLGQRISPIEIETVINTCKGVLESGVIETGNSDGIAIRAYVVLQEEKEVQAEDIVNYLKRRLPPYMIPHSIEFIDTLPKTYNNKIQRAKLRERASESA
jgi:acyl-CoA synthetase (AMP-forming)/AMP-acid ligase II